MHKILAFVFVFFSFISFSQVTIPPDIKKIHEKAGEEFTVEEEAKMKKWTETMKSQVDKMFKQTSRNATAYSNAQHPKKVTLPALEELTKEKYI